MQSTNELSASVSQLAIHDHICLIYESDEQRFRTILPFISNGLTKGEQCVYIADENTTDQVLSALQKSGVDTGLHLRQGSLVICDKHTSYLRNGSFDPDEMLEYLIEFSQESKKLGFPVLRLTGEMTWALGEKCGLDRLIEYESKLNRLYREIDALGVCQYNRHRFPSSILRGVVYTHPVVAFNDSVIANPVFVQPERFDVATHEEIELDALLKTVQISNNLKSINTQLTDATRELAVARDEAIELSKQKSAFISYISHELRTPLSGILTVGELLADTSLSPEQKQLVQILQGSTTTMLSILNDILDLSKIEAGRVALEKLSLDVKQIAQEAARVMSVDAATKGIVLSTHFDRRLPELVKGDPHRLKQIITNLVSNAIKFTSNGKVSLSIRCIDSAQGSVSLSITVADSGCGMTVKQLNRLFIPFVQSDDSIARRFGGTGLGLSITKQLVEMMGGKIAVRSTPGKGTVFRTTIPFECPARTKSCPGDSADSAGEFDRNCLKGCSILVVEDNPMIQQLTVRQLAFCGAIGMPVESGAEALAALRNGEFDAVLLDCGMPEMDGYETCRRIRQEESATGKHIPIIALTAAAMASDAERCLKAGMDGYLSKPVSIKKLSTTLSAFIKTSLMFT